MFEDQFLITDNFPKNKLYFTIHFLLKCVLQKFRYHHIKKEKRIPYSLTWRELNIANKYWNTTAAPPRDKTPKTHVNPSVGSNAHIPRMPLLWCKKNIALYNENKHHILQCNETNNVYEVIIVL